MGDGCHNCNNGSFIVDSMGSGYGCNFLNNNPPKAGICNHWEACKYTEFGKLTINTTKVYR